ncbi:MAG: hypothetical protein ACT4QC_20925 [Planctomycetaceae bacterium]
MNDDLQQLNLLAIFHYVVAGIAVLLGSVPIIHVAIGIALLSGAFPQKPDERFPETLVGAFFVACGALAIVMAWSLAVGMFLAGRRLKQHRKYMFCLVIAGVECLLMPFGTVLGVFTLIVLQRPSVKRLFGHGGSPAAADAPWGANPSA